MRKLRLIILALAVAFAVALVGTRAILIRQDNAAALQRTAAGAEDLARLVEQYARRTFETADLAAEIVIAEIVARGGVTSLRGDAAFAERLTALTRRSHQEYLIVVDAAGLAVATNVPRMVALDQGFDEREWFQAIRGGAEVDVGKAKVSALTGDILFTFSRAIRRPDGSLDGVIAIGIAPRFFEDVALTSEGGRRAVLSLWLAEGPVMARTGLTPELTSRRFSAPDQLAAAMREGHAAFRHRSAIDGLDRLVALRRVADWPVVAVASLPAEAGLAAYARTHDWTTWATAATLLALGLLAAVALRLSRRAEASAAAVEAARTVLEERVAERTRALAEANARLAENEARLRGIFNSSFQFTGLLAPDGAIIEANQAAQRFCGLSAPTLVGKPLWESGWVHMDAEATARMKGAVARAAAGDFVRYEVAVKDKGAVVDFSLKPVAGPDGKIALLVAEARDITELKTAQAQLHEAQKLETLGQLTGGVAHDFNNLLMVVLGNLALLRKRLPADDARLQKLLDGATQGAERGAALVKRLLAFARRQELRPEAIDLGKLVAGMEELLGRTVGPLCRIAVDIPDDLPPARADVNQLELALLNLAVNARDAMPLGGELRILARAAEPDEAAPAGLAAGRYLCLAVADSGTGMDAATLARATEPFFTTKGPGKGSGLGLSMVQGLAVQSGGQLRIDSQPGRGTTVELWLPAAAKPAEAAPATASVAPLVGRPLDILLVDDDPLVQAGSAAMLEDLGHRVTIAGSGQAALDILATAAFFDLMVTDYAMPGMDGLELARRAAALRPLLPVVLATGYADLSAMTDSSLPRLEKPYTQEALASLIGRVIPGAETAKVIRLPLARNGG